MKFRRNSDVEEKESLDDSIDAVERRLAFNRMRAGAELRYIGMRTRRRITAPTSLLFAGSLGFIAAEIMHSRKMRRKSRKSAAPLIRRLAALLAPVMSIMQSVWSASGSLLPGLGDGRSSRIPAGMPADM